jgi:molybdate transport system ATP-binding protein
MNQLVARFSRQFRGAARIDGRLDIPAQGFSVLVLFGPSGSGKTTILRCLAGLDVPEEGSIRFGDETWFDAESRTNLSPQQRSVGYLFQQYALFPHLTVRGNIAFGIKGDTVTARQRVAQLLDRFELAGLDDRYAHQLSGGQQQRVALARTLACEPRLLLLDEPLSSLDQALGEEVRGQLRDWLAAFGVPTILVTHDRADAMALGDNIVVLSEGRVLQQGPIQEVFAAPANLAVARIVGVETILPGRVVQRSDELVGVDINGVLVWGTARHVAGDRVLACIRGEDVMLSRAPLASGSVRNQLPAKVATLTDEGPLVRVGLDCGFRITALITRPACQELGLRPGDSSYALVKATAVHVIAH